MPWLKLRSGCCTALPGLKPRSVWRSAQRPSDAQHILVQRQIEQQNIEASGSGIFFFLLAVGRGVALHCSVKSGYCGTSGSGKIVELVTTPKRREFARNPQPLFCPNLDCPSRGKQNESNLTVHDGLKDRFRCSTCQTTFSSRKGTRFCRLEIEWFVSAMLGNVDK